MSPVGDGTRGGADAHCMLPGGRSLGIDGVQPPIHNATIIHPRRPEAAAETARRRCHWATIRPWVVPYAGGTSGIESPLVSGNPPT